jgi:hypothetical protein
MAQFDDGFGKIGSASLAGFKKAEGKNYKDLTDGDSNLIAVRLVAKKGAGKYMIGYSKIADKADIIAPWRGFPTGGYTRSMGQYNWYANTETYMIKAWYNFGKAGLISGFRTAIDYAIQDFDETKINNGGSQLVDGNILHIDMWKTFATIPNFEMKVMMNVLIFINFQTASCYTIELPQ